MVTPLYKNFLPLEVSSYSILPTLFSETLYPPCTSVENKRFIFCARFGTVFAPIPVSRGSLKSQRLLLPADLGPHLIRCEDGMDFLRGQVVRVKLMQHFLRLVEEKFRSLLL